MNEQDLLFEVTSRRLQAICDLLDGNTIPDRKTWDMWRDYYNDIAEQAGLLEFPSYEDCDYSHDYWNPVA